MGKRSAGLLMYRVRGGVPPEARGVEIQVLLVHPGGPLWAGKDLGAWSIPKGEYTAGENALETAKREFEEETGIVPEGDFTALGEIRQDGGKVVAAWGFEGDCDPREVRSNMFTMEWPPRSGREQTFPEIDRAEWIGLEEARKRIVNGQVPILEELERVISQRGVDRSDL